MKLEVGMYVRTKEFGIQKVKGFDNEEPILENGFTALQKDFKASHNIIDLIEEGDYVNGMEVTRISGTRYDKNDLHCYCEHNGNENWKQVMIPAKNIKSIVTREQFENASYKVD